MQKRADQLLVVEELRERLERIGNGPHRLHESLPFGVDAIDHHLPGGGLKLGCLHEVSGGGNGAADGAAAALFAAGVAARLSGKVLWCVTRRDLFMPGLTQAGLSQNRLIIVECRDEKGVLDCFEEGLRCNGFGDRPEPKNKDRTNHLSLFVFNMLAAPCEMRTNGVHTISILLHCLCGFNNLKVVQMAQNSLRLVEDKSVDKSKALEAALSQIERSFGKGSIMKLGSNENVVEVETVSTGSLSLDIALGIGGLPKGRIVEIYGPESSGKTTLALQTIAEAQKKGGICAFVDAEHALDPVYARKLGVDLQSLLISQPDTGEQALEITDTLVRSGAVDVLVVDSVAALTPRAEIEGEMGDSLPGLQARLMSQALRKLTASISKSKCIVLFINQIRHKIGVMYGSPETTTGGNALKFYASVRLDIRRTGAIKNRDEVVGNTTRVKVVKNKVAPPFREVIFDIMYGEGISKIGEIIDLGVKANIIEKSGSWFSYDSTRIGQGRENAKEFLKNNPDMALAIEKAVRQSTAKIADDMLGAPEPDEGQDLEG